MAPATDSPITVRMETGQPNTGRITIHAEPENADDLRRAFEELGLSTSDTIELSVPEVLTTVFQVQNILGSAGLATFVRGLSLWLHRNDKKDVEITVNGQKFSFKGMGEAEIARIMRERQKEWDDQWREQFPDRFPPDPDDEPQ
jgi:hypothetical protein